MPHSHHMQHHGDLLPHHPLPQPPSYSPQTVDETRTRQVPKRVCEDVPKRRRECKSIQVPQPPYVCSFLLSSFSSDPCRKWALSTTGSSTRSNATKCQSQFAVRSLVSTRCHQRESKHSSLQVMQQSVCPTCMEPNYPGIGCGTPTCQNPGVIMPQTPAGNPEKKQNWILKNRRSRLRHISAWWRHLRGRQRHVRSLSEGKFSLKTSISLLQNLLLLSISVLWQQRVVTCSASTTQCENVVEEVCQQVPYRVRLSTEYLIFLHFAQCFIILPQSGKKIFKPIGFIKSHECRWQCQGRRRSSRRRNGR